MITKPWQIPTVAVRGGNLQYLAITFDRRYDHGDILTVKGRFLKRTLQQRLILIWCRTRRAVMGREHGHNKAGRCKQVGCGANNTNIVLTLIEHGALER